MTIKKELLAVIAMNKREHPGVENGILRSALLKNFVIGEIQLCNDIADVKQILRDYYDVDYNTAT